MWEIHVEWNIYYWKIHKQPVLTLDYEVIGRGYSQILSF